MLNKYITENGKLRSCDDYVPGCWVRMTDPTKQECEEVAAKYGIDITDMRAAMDDEESSRIDAEDDYALILFDIPSVEIKHNQENYTTIPLGIIWTENAFITICTEESPIFNAFVNNMVKQFSTKKQVRFCYQILLKTCMQYQSYLRVIERRRIEIEERVSSKMEDSDIILLHEMETTLVYFDTSLRANKMVLEKLARYSKIKKFPEDEDLFDDVVIENMQAIEMTQIYRDIVRGTRELMTSVIDNRLNNVMKYLAAITIVMSIPTIISGLYGMNVLTEYMPFANTPYGFGIICAITVAISIVIGIMLKKRKML